MKHLQSIRITRPKMEIQSNEVVKKLITNVFQYIGIKDLH